VDPKTGIVSLLTSLDAEKNTGYSLVIGTKENQHFDENATVTVNVNVLVGFEYFYFLMMCRF